MDALIRLVVAALLLPAFASAGISVEVEGNQALRSRVLMEAVPPDPEKLEAEELAAWREDALFNLEDLYRREGYFDSRVELALTRKEGEKPDDFVAKVLVTEGERYAFDTVRVVVALDTADTSRVGTPADLGLRMEDDDLDARAGDPFKEDMLFRDRRWLIRTFGNAGYVRAQVRDRVDVRPLTRTVAVEYLIEPSYPVVFDTLLINNRRPPPVESARGITREEILRDLVPYGRGDTVRIGRNDRMIEKLQYTGAFNFVRLKDSLLEDGGGRSALLLEAEERIPGSLRTSLFYETQYGAGVSFDARHSNVAGSLNELRAGVQTAYLQQSGYMGYGSPLTFGRLVRFDQDFATTWYQGLDVHEDVGFFDGDFRGVSSTRLTFPWSYWFNAVGAAEMEGKSRMTTEDKRERFLNLNFIETAGLAFVNQGLDPTRGLRFAFTWGNGGPLYKNDLFRFGEYRHNWLEARTAQYWYYPPLRQFKVATRLDGGRFFGNGEANSERFFLGGSRSVRSYGFQGLCTEYTVEGVCVGEDKTLAYALASGEFRMELFALGFINPRGWLRHIMPLQVVPFVDVGKVWEVRKPFRITGPDGTRPKGQGYAHGLGLRYPLLGIFNLRLDFASGSGPKHFWVDLAQAF